MRVLIIKTSSMGDIIHTLPAITDAAKALPDIQFDWVVEEAFKEIPRWHPLVADVIPMALRRWRKQPWQAIRSGEIAEFLRHLRAKQYDVVIDAQGLVKSALLTYLSRGVRSGLNWQSAWEPLASLAYQKRYVVKSEQHAVTRVRQLLSAALNYPVNDSIPDYGIDKTIFTLPQGVCTPYMVFLHGTTWSTKHWPESSWAALITLATNEGYHIYLPWGNEAEQKRAQRLASLSTTHVHVLPKMKLAEIAALLAGAKAAVAVDTGLGHLAAALNVPTISLYGPTNPQLTGTVGANQTHLAAQFACAPCLKPECTYHGADLGVVPACFSQLSPRYVWHELQQILKSSDLSKA